MVNSSVSIPQGPLLIVQRKMFVPIAKPEMVVEGEVEFAKVAVPCTILHCPVAGICGVFAEILNEVKEPLQTIWSWPAFAAG